MNHLFLKAICSNHEQITHFTLFKRAMIAIHSRLLFCKEQQERFTHGCSFLKSNESDSLTVSFFKRAARVNRSQLLFKMSYFELKSKFPTLLIGGAPDFWDRGPGFKSGISPTKIPWGAAGSLCNKKKKSQGKARNVQLRQKKIQKTLNIRCGRSDHKHWLYLLIRYKITMKIDFL